MHEEPSVTDGQPSTFAIVGKPRKEQCVDFLAHLRPSGSKQGRELQTVSMIVLMQT